MISRIVNCSVKKQNLETLRRQLATDFIPRIRQQNGFVDLIESVDPNTGTFVCNTFWKTTNDVKAYDNGLFQEIAAALTPMLETPPSNAPSAKPVEPVSGSLLVTSSYPSSGRATLGGAGSSSG